MSERLTELFRSKSGLYCLWECGGGLTNTGSAQVITSPTGKPKRAIYIRTHGQLCCSNHALIPVKVGDCIVTVERHCDMISIQVERITAISGDTAFLERTDDLISYDAIKAAVEKSQHYHCREPYYIRQLFEEQSTAQVGTQDDQAKHKQQLVYVVIIKAQQPRQPQEPEEQGEQGVVS